MNFVNGSFHKLKLLSRGTNDHKHDCHRQNEKLRFLTHAFPPMIPFLYEWLDAVSTGCSRRTKVGITAERTKIQSAIRSPCLPSTEKASRKLRQHIVFPLPRS